MEPTQFRTVRVSPFEETGGLRSVSITRRLISITKAHQAAGFVESPSSSRHSVVNETLKGIRRSIGTAQKGKDPPLTSDIRQIVASWTLRDIRAFVKGMHFSLEQLLPEIVRYDAWASGTHFNLPILLFQGENDLLTLTAEAQAYFGDLEAPAKRMELIGDAGHFAMFL